MSVDDVRRFMASRIDKHFSAGRFLTNTADRWREEQVDSAWMPNLFQVLNEKDEVEIRRIEEEWEEFEEEIVFRTGPISLPDEINQNYVDLYIKHARENLAKRADDKAVEFELVHAGWHAYNSGCDEVLKQVRMIMNLDEESLRSLEKRLFYKKRKIFTTLLRHSSGVPTRFGSKWISGIYEIEDLEKTPMHCHVANLPTRLFPLFDYDEFCRLNDYAGYHSFSEEVSFKREMSIDCSTESILELARKLSIEQLMTYKHDVLVSQNSDFPHKFAMSSGLQIKGPSTCQSTQSSTSTAVNLANTESDRMEVGSSSSTRPGPSSGLAARSAPSFDSTEGVSSNNRNNMMDVSPRNELSLNSSDFCEVMEVISDESLVCPRPNDDAERIQQVPQTMNSQQNGVRTDAMTIDNWEEMFNHFSNLIVITEDRKTEAARIAVVLRPRLMSIYKAAHEFDHYDYMKNFKAEYMTEDDVKLFLFAIYQKKNHSIGIVIYEVLFSLYFKLHGGARS